MLKVSCPAFAKATALKEGFGLRPTKSEDAKDRSNSSVLAPFLSPELAMGYIPFDFE